jgi:restriction endonuclease S subunit
LGLNHESIELNADEWEPFKLSQIFEIKKGKRITKLDLIPGNTPFISAIDNNNGIRQYVGVVPNHTSNTITVNCNGSVGKAFYQEKSFWASDDVNVLYPKFDLNKYIALFIITLIEKEKFRFNYGRKWHKERMDEGVIHLPVKEDGSPNYDLMERYVKSLKYSQTI